MFSRRKRSTSSGATSGPGLGFLDIFSPDGRLLQRLEHGDWLKCPLGVALAPTIAAYDLAFIGLVEDSTGTPISISSLWALAVGNGAEAGSYDPAGAPGAELYFTAGPNHGAGGLLGYLTPVAAELTQGNDQ